MAVPDFQSLMLPTLQALSVRAEIPISQVPVRVAAAPKATSWILLVASRRSQEKP